MNEESGRSLIEIVGVLAIGALMIVSAYRIYKSIDNRQTRLIASETLKDIAVKTKTLYEFSGYGNVSIAKLQTDGVLSSDRAPIGTSWDIESTSDNNAFVITIGGLSYNDCEYFKIKKIDWGIAIADMTIKNESCSKENANRISWTIR